MTEVMFHFNVPDLWSYSCRLLRKAHAQGARVAVVGPDEDLGRLDRLLWETAPAEFLPHCRMPGAPRRVLDASPVVLCPVPAASPHDDVLLNVGPAVPAGFERFRRLIELVGCDDDDRQRGRERWRHYGARGYAIVTHDVGAPAAAS